VRVIEARAKVPDRVSIRGKKYQITYLEDHKMRLEEALRRRDPDRLNMLYGQLASKVKYQAIRATPERAQPVKAASPKRATMSARSRPSAAKKVSRPHKKSGSTPRRPSRAARSRP